MWLPEQLDNALSYVADIAEFAQSVGTLLFKLSFFLVLVRFVSWRIGVVYWLACNVVGCVALTGYIFRGLWWFLQNCVGDNSFISAILLGLLLCHELDLIDVPRLFKALSANVYELSHRVLDVTGDGRFNHQDVAKIAAEVITTVKDLYAHRHEYWQQAYTHVKENENVAWLMTWIKAVVSETHLLIVAKSAKDPHSPSKTSPSKSSTSPNTRKGYLRLPFGLRKSKSPTKTDKNE